MKPVVDETIDQLQCWRDAFLNGSDWDFEREHGMVEITDHLDGISLNDHKCYASFLFEQLEDKDKVDVQSKLDFYINFDELYCVYDLPTKGGDK